MRGTPGRTAMATTKRPVHERIRKWWRSRAAQVKFALCLLVASIIGWPVSAVTFARNEPATVLGLSWLAISITALDVLFTSRVHETQTTTEDEDPGRGDPDDRPHSDVD